MLDAQHVQDMLLGFLDGHFLSTLPQIARVKTSLSQEMRRRMMHLLIHSGPFNIHGIGKLSINNRHIFIIRIMNVYYFVK